MASTSRLMLRIPGMVEEGGVPKLVETHYLADNCP